MKPPLFGKGTPFFEKNNYSNKTLMSGLLRG